MVRRWVWRRRGLYLDREYNVHYDKFDFALAQFGQFLTGHIFHIRPVDGIKYVCVFTLLIFV